MKIPFNKPYMSGKELRFIEQAHDLGHLAGDGKFTRHCHQWLEQQAGCEKALLTHSCTAALEMSALLLDLQPGDEVIMPSFTFVSTANAFVLRGATPVFVDIRADTLNIDETLVEDAITPRTRAICVVHYAGVGCEMDTILDIARRHGLAVVEDAAQGIMATYRDKPLGSFGELGTLSFHETKNVISGEGGALLINDGRMVERAEIIREKGTNRSKFFRGQIDKYTWVDAGSSYLPSELTALSLPPSWRRPRPSRAVDWNCGIAITNGPGNMQSRDGSSVHSSPRIASIMRTCSTWSSPRVEKRTQFINFLRKDEIHAVFHYVPLHASPAGQRHCRTHGSLKVTEDISERLVRMPMWIGLDKHLPRILETADSFFRQDR